MGAVSPETGAQQPSRLLLATTNRHKIDEFRELLRDLPCAVMDPMQIGLTLDVPETGTSFMENATLKALGWARASGMLTLADDSGLEIDALGGEPGLYSARWAGHGTSYPERFARILARLQDVPPARRTARYRCALVVAAPDAVLVSVEGTVEGRIAAEPRGTGGFGYDPLFELPDQGRTFGEMTAAEKHWISHRGRAVAAAIPRLEQVCVLSQSESPSI